MPWRIDSWIHVFVDGNGWFFNVFVNKNPLLEIHILKTIMVIMFLLHHCFMPWDPWNHVFEIHSCNVHSQYYDRRWFGEPKHGGRCFDGQIHGSFMEEVFLMSKTWKHLLLRGSSAPGNLKRGASSGGGDFDNWYRRWIHLSVFILY